MNRAEVNAIIDRAWELTKCGLFVEKFDMAPLQLMRDMLWLIDDGVPVKDVLEVVNFNAIPDAEMELAEWRNGLSEEITYWRDTTDNEPANAILNT